MGETVSFMDSTNPSPEQPESKPDQPLDEPSKETGRVSYELTVSEDKLKAYLSAKVKGDVSITIEDLKNFLKEQGISYGLVSDSQIEEYINQGAILSGSCLMAEGMPPQPGEDAHIDFFFDRDPLKIGKLKNGDAIDFKDKGDIPQVKAGDLLAEKIPLVREKPGVDIHKSPIPVEKAKDVIISSGTGTKRSADGLKIYSQISGRPELLCDGRLCVLPEIRINGDVGLETGHIHFDGFVDVRGTIQEGFQVKAARLAAKEIFRAEVEIDGDIVVDGGIIGSTVSSRGNVKCRFIDASHIRTLGDVIVEREIMNSKIETNGALIALPGGKIIVSQVMAKKGVAALEIGSEFSKPCSLTVGIDIGADSQTKKIVEEPNEEISKKQKEKEKVKNNLERISTDSLQLSEKIFKWTQIQAQATVEQSSIKKRIEELKEENDPARLAQAKRELEKVEHEFMSSEETLGKLLDQQDRVKQETSALQSLIQELDSEIQKIEDKIDAELEQYQLKENPTVKVTKAIYSGTSVQGCRCKVVLKDNLSGTLIREGKVKVVTAEGKETLKWQMKLTSLK
jgi:hypothetical protein